MRLQGLRDRGAEEIEAGAPLKKADRSMVGGFTFQLSPYDDQPFLRIKHLNSHSAFFRFAKASAAGGCSQPTPQG